MGLQGAEGGAGLTSEHRQPQHQRILPHGAAGFGDHLQERLVLQAQAPQQFTEFRLVPELVAPAVVSLRPLLRVRYERRCVALQASVQFIGIETCFIVEVILPEPLLSEVG